MCRCEKNKCSCCGGECGTNQKNGQSKQATNQSQKKDMANSHKNQLENRDNSNKKNS